MEAFKTSDGVELIYEVFGAPSGAPPVVLHHGFAASTQVNWVVPGIVAALEDAKRWVVSIDARGHGCSEKPRDPDLYGEKTMARDLLELVRRLDLPAYDLVGYSMGAVVALLVAARDDTVRRLIVGGVGSAAVDLGGVDRRVLSPAAIVTALEAEDAATVADPLARQFRALVDATGADRLALAAQARAVHAEPIPLHRIRARTLVIAGDADPLAASPEVLAGAIPGAELRRAPGDHVSVLFEPAFRESIVSFLGSG